MKHFELIPDTDAVESMVVCANNLSTLNPRIARGNVLGVHIVPQSGNDVTIADSNPNESICFSEDDSNQNMNCSGLLRNGFLFIAVSIGEH